MSKAAEEKNDPKAKYALIYAKDLRIPAGDPDNNEMETFSSFVKFLWFMARNKHARAAARAGRTQFVTIDRKKK